MFCTHCGAGLPDGARHCPACGRSTGTTAGVVTSEDATFFGQPPSAADADEGQTIAAPISGGSRGAAFAPDVTRGTDAGVTVAPGVPRGTAAGGTRGTGGHPLGADMGPLAPGSAFGARYHLIRLLGMGGMGAVYQAWDDALGVAVALKVIRPEITADPAGARDIERRFKRELLLARQVTHKNVVRIHDLGEIDGIKYLTMPYIQGSDLATILRKEGKLPVPRIVSIARQVVSGVRAAHEAGVVHRDLKPANIMVDADDLAVIMDFGISRSIAGGETVAGAVVGTLEYMAPEQAMGKVVDHRADIYSIGLIFYDMVLGPRQSTRAESAVADLMMRVQNPMPPVRSIDPSIPEALERIIARCTEPDPAARYQTTAELAHDVDLLDAGGRAPTGTGILSAPPVTRTAPPIAAPAPARKSISVRTLGIAAALVLMLGGAAWMFRDRIPGIGSGRPAGTRNTVALAVLPFRNGTGDPSLDWLGGSLPEMIRGEVGQSQQLRLVSAERVAQLSRDLGLSTQQEIPPDSLRQIADFSNADTVVSGRFVKLGEQLRIEASVQNSKTGGDPVVLTATAGGANDVMRAVRDLAQGIQQNLSLGSAAVKELQTHAFKPSTQSMPALQAYNEGVQLAAAGERLEALKRFEASTKEDPNFALAHSKLAQTYSLVGKSAEAEKASQKAVDLSANLPAKERDLVASTHAVITNDLDTAVAAYERLLKARPSDTQLHFDLGRLLERKGELARARGEFDKVLEAEPKHVDALYWKGRVSVGLRDYNGALEPLTTALNLSVQLDNNEAKANILQALGITYKRLNKLDDAQRQYQQSLEIKRKIGDKRGIAMSVSEIAQIQHLKGHPEESYPSYKEAIEQLREIGDRVGVGITLTSLGAAYLDGGKYTEALDCFKEALQIQRDLGDEERQARSLSNIGNVYYSQAQYEDARTYLERALELREKMKVGGNVALTLTSLGDVSQKLGDYQRAQSQYLRAIELWRSASDKRGAATSSYAMGTLLEAQGKFGAALEAKEGALKSFRELEERSAAFGDILIGYGTSLSLVGRFDEADKILAEGLALSRELHNENMVAQTLNAQGDNAFFRGDLKTARDLYVQAQQAATRGGSRFDGLVARLNLAKIGAEEGRAGAVGDLDKLMAEADSLGLKLQAAQCSLYSGIAMVRSKNGAGAVARLETALSKADRLGAKPLQARAHGALSEAYQLTGKSADSATHLKQAKDLLAEMRTESRSQTLLARQDFKSFAQ
jgi:eukaryotic-like serine/threonine-protein kinase